MRFTGHIAAALLGTTSLAITAVPAWSQERHVTRQYDLPAQDLGSALITVGRLSGTEIIFEPETVEGKVAPALSGTMSADEAVEHLLRGSGLVAQVTRGAIIIRGRSDAAAADRETTNPIDTEIVVTGTHIRGGEPASPIIAATREQIEDSGQTDLGGYIRLLPQNFGGGQNPGIVGGGNQGGNENLNSSSDLNLRGLGPDATLTLINGHRVAYDGAVQGVDISAIPLAALDRIEIVPDGSSALYGSDAVGGVANVILRKDYDGLWTSARLGAATEGGDTVQQYSAVAGRHWSSGGFLVAGDYSDATAITAGQRSVTQNLDPLATLLPWQRQIAFVATGHQALTDQLKLKVDAQYSDRKTAQDLPSTTTDPASINGVVTAPLVQTWSVTPTLELTLARSWRLSLSGTIGRSLTSANSTSNYGGIAAISNFVRYDNRIKSVELDGDGPLFALPGGDVRIAAGVGYRSLSLGSLGVISTPTFSLTVQDIASTQNVAYGFGEISIPVVGSANAIPLIEALSLSAAVRFEDYEDLAEVASPKLGLVYRPVSDLTLRASWGESFKAPTFYERYKILQTILYNATDFGGTNPNQTVLYVAGGNPDLQPERATTWTATATFKPRVLSGFEIEASYFHIRYRNRVVTPITSSLGLFGNPLYQSLITYNPTASQINGLVGNALLGLQNFSDQAYDPNNVYAIIDANLQNTALAKIQGVDLSAKYDFVRGIDHFNLSGSVSYLNSQSQLLAGQPFVAASGVIFMPPDWRGRAGAVWNRRVLTLSAFVNYTGGTLDNRMLPYVRVGSFTSLDLTARIASPIKSGLLAQTDLLLSVQNVTDEKPAIIRNSTVTDPPYDTTNYSIVGRTVSVTLAKRW